MEKKDLIVIDDITVIKVFWAANSHALKQHLSNLNEMGISEKNIDHIMWAILEWHEFLLSRVDFSQELLQSLIKYIDCELIEGGKNAFLDVVQNSKNNDDLPRLSPRVINIIENIDDGEIYLERMLSYLFIEASIIPNFAESEDLSYDLGDMLWSASSILDLELDSDMCSRAIGRHEDFMNGVACTLDADIDLLTDYLESFDSSYDGYGPERKVSTTECMIDAINNSPIKIYHEQETEHLLATSLVELNSLIGLDSVKKEIQTTVNLIKIRLERQKQGLSNPDTSFHMIFSGNPGTGKTTVGRLVGKILKALDILEDGHLVEVSRSDLVGGYIGQTAIKTEKVFKKALGGVLFIDEAYSLTRDGNSGSDYGQEAVDTLVKLMEDYRHDIVVIAGGYLEEMDEFLDSNPGIRSRFQKIIKFPDYSVHELSDIFTSMCKSSGYIVDNESTATLAKQLERRVRTDPSRFGNGRGVRNLFEKCIQEQANRLSLGSPTKDELSKLTAWDIEKASKAIRA